MSNIKLVTLNVEGNRHWNDIVPFLERESPDVVCLQEFFDRDAKMLTDRFGYRYVHLPITQKPYDPNDISSLAGEGSALLTTLPLESIGSAYYYRAAPEIQIFRGSTLAEKRATIHQGVVWGTVLKYETRFTIATTNFTWTPDGKPNENQDRDIQSLFKVLSDIPDLILCGDFNAPRGENRIYHAFIERFKDNIPTDIKTTIDVDRHYARKNDIERAKLATFVVDYIFSTPEYTVNNVRCEYGLSDHCAIIANVTCGSND